jgi:hypothetical protein
MKMHVLLMFALAVVVATASPALAQRGGGRGPGFGGGRGPGGNSLGLLTQKSVQDELKMSDEQIKKATEQVEKQRESFAGLRDLSREERQAKMQENAKANAAVLADILKEDQLKRFKQISLQQRGGQALADPEIAQALGLSTEQKDRIQAIQEASQNEMRELFQAGAADGDRQEMQKKTETLRAAVNDKSTAVLSAEQQTKWKELNGEPFKGEIRRPGRGGGRPGAAAPLRNRRASA